MHCLLKFIAQSLLAIARYLGIFEYPLSIIFDSFVLQSQEVV